MAQLLKVNNSAPNLPNIGIGSGQAPAPTPSIYIGNQAANYTPPPAPSAQHPTWGGAPTVHPTIAQPLPFKFGSGVKNPILKLPGEFLNSVLNSPAQIGQGITQVAQHNYKAGAGQIGSGLLNAASVLPVGKAVEGGLKGASLAEKAVKGFTTGVKVGGAYGAAQGATNAMANNENTKNIALNTLLGGATGALAGGALGGAAPVATAGIKGVAKRVSDIPKNESGFAKLPGENRFQKNAKNAYKVVSGQKDEAAIQAKNTPQLIKFTKEVHDTLVQKRLDKGDKRGADFNQTLGYIRTLSVPDNALKASTKNRANYVRQLADRINKVVIKPQNPDGKAYINTSYLIKDPAKSSRELSAGPSSPASPVGGGDGTISALESKTPLGANYAEKPNSLRPSEIAPRQQASVTPIVPPKGVKVNPVNKTMPPDFLQPTMGRKGISSEAVPSSAGSHAQNAPVQHLSDNSLPSVVNPGKSLQKAPQLPLRIHSEAGNLPRGTKLLQEQKTTPQIPSSSINHATNPTKVNIPEVNPGDYGKARSNAQLASAPIEYAAGQASRTAKGLTTSRLGGLVEGTIKPASAKEAEAVTRYRQLTDRAHATSQALGGSTPYRANYFHHEWDLSNPEMAAKFEQFRQRKFGKELNPSQFEGIDTQPRVFNTVAQGEAAGFKLKNPNAQSDILDYGKSSAYALKRQALSKGFMEADANQLSKPHSFDMGQGKTIALSDKGRHEIRSFETTTQQPNAALRGYRKVNRGAKQTLLSASEFHPINITKKVAPGLALKGHPVLATKGAYGAFRAQLGSKYSDALQQSFQEKGIVDFGARVGSPLKFGSDYATEGKLDIKHSGIGEKTIFEKSMPALHGRALQALKSDLEKKNISFDSPQARAAGTRINEMMGFVNTEVRNLDKGHQKFLGDVALAPQFTRAKWATIKSALKDRGVAGSYARRAVIGDTLATATVMLGLGYLTKQKSDNIKDLLIRALVHPSVPTPMKDKKGNTIELGMPSTYTSEALGLVAKISRGKDGHLGINFKPSNLPGNLKDYGRARLAIVPASGLKVATNTDYANKPLFDPNAPAGTKAQQAITTLLGGLAPIGTQGLLQTNAIKSHLPQGSQQVLNANAPGSSPLLKSIGSSFGLTPRTDKTVGKGLQTTQYFDALAKASQGLNRQEKDALDILTGGKKNPVTGAYDISPNANDSSTKAKLLLQNPNVIDKLISLNQTLSSQGQKVDPLWLQSKDQIVKAMQYATMPPGGNDRTIWEQANGSWYNPLQTQRNAFFNTLPPADPNKPKSPIAYPTASPQIQTLENKFFATTDPKIQSQMIKDNPGLIQQFQAQHDYTNKLREAQGYSPLNGAPQASDYVQKLLDSIPTGTDTASKKATSAIYKDPQVAQFLQNVSVYNLAKNSALAQYQGQTLNQKALKAINSVGQYDIVKNPDGTLALNGSPDIQPGAKGVGFNNSLKTSSGKSGGSGRGRKTGPGSRGGKIKVPKTPKINTGVYKVPKTPKIHAPKVAYRKPSTRTGKLPVSHLPKIAQKKSPFA